MRRKTIQSVASSWIAGHNVQVGRVGGDLDIRLGERHFHLEKYPDVPARSATPARPSHLLDPAQQLVRYRARPDEEERLAQWRDDPSPGVSVLYVYGPGGQGKTRLAHHVAAASSRDGWDVVRADHRPQDANVGGRLDGTRPLLAVVDYAERWPLPALLSLVRSLQRPAGRVRILLLGRPEDAWDEIEAELDRLDVATADPLGLGPLTVGGRERMEAFHEAIGAFSMALNGPATAIRPPDLDDEAFGSPLILHMAALAALYAGQDRQAPPGRADLSAFLLKHERRYWNAIAAIEGRPLTSKFESLVLVATLFGPFLDAAAAKGAVQHAELADGPVESGDLLTLHRFVYPISGRNRALEPLAPDRLAEDFIGHHLHRNPDAAALIRSLIEDDSGVDDDAVRRCLAMLAASGLRHPASADLLYELFHWAPGLVGYASRPVIDFLAQHAPVDVLERIQPQIANRDVNLVRPALLIAQRLYDALPADEVGHRRASWLVNLAGAMFDCGDWHGAVEYGNQAVAAWRTLAEADSERASFALVLALRNLAVALHRLGRQREALDAMLEATELCRTTGEPRELAITLTHLGGAQSEVGHKRAAVASAREAVDILQTLGEPGDADGGLATCLMNLGLALIETGNSDEALEPLAQAVRILRTLHESTPDAYDDALATVLFNYGSILSDVGEQDQALAVAEEAAAIRRRLAEVEPAIHAHDLAGSLVNLSSRRADAGDNDGAFTAASEAVRLYRQCAGRDPALFDRNAVTALSNLARLHSIRGEDLQALALMREAVGEAARLVAAEPAGHLTLLASMTRNLATALHGVDDPTAAAVASEAVSAYRRLRDLEPGVYDRDLAGALANLSAVQPAGDIAALQEAAQLYRALAATDAVACRRLADVLTVLTTMYAKSKPAAALEPSSEAVAIRQELATKDNTWDSCFELAMALHRSAGIRHRTGTELDVALSDAVKAFKIYAWCDEERPELVAEHGFAVTTLIAEILEALGEHDQARTVRGWLDANEEDTNIDSSPNLEIGIS